GRSRGQNASTKWRSPSLTPGAAVLARTALDTRRQALGHLDFRAVVDRPGDLVRHRLDQARRRRMAVAALLDAAERQMDLGADARQVDVAHAELALLAEQAHGAVVLGDDRQRQAVVGIVVNLDRLVIILE